MTDTLGRLGNTKHSGGNNLYVLLVGIWHFLCKAASHFCPSVMSTMNTASSSGQEPVKHLAQHRSSTVVITTAIKSTVAQLFQCPYCNSYFCKAVSIIMLYWIAIESFGEMWGNALSASLTSCSAKQHCDTNNPRPHCCWERQNVFMQSTCDHHTVITHQENSASLHIMAMTEKQN